MKRDEQEQNTPSASRMGNISSAFGSASGDLDPGRNTVSFSVCGDKNQGFSQHGLLSHLAAAPVDFYSFEPTLHRGSTWEGCMEHSYNLWKTDSETCMEEEDWGMLSRTTPVRE